VLERRAGHRIYLGDFKGSEAAFLLLVSLAIGPDPQEIQPNEVWKDENKKDSKERFA